MWRTCAMLSLEVMHSQADLPIDARLFYSDLSSLSEEYRLRPKTLLAEAVNEVPPGPFTLAFVCPRDAGQLRICWSIARP
jgi:hypothetical protein